MPVQRSVEVFDLSWQEAPAARTLGLERAQGHYLTAAKEQSYLAALRALPEGEWHAAPFECPLCLEPVEEGASVRRLGCRIESWAAHSADECARGGGFRGGLAATLGPAAARAWPHGLRTPQGDAGLHDGDLLNLGRRRAQRAAP